MQPRDARRAQHEHITAVPPTADGTAIDHERAGRGTSTPSRKTSTACSCSLSAAGGVLFVSAPTPCNLSFSYPDKKASITAGCTKHKRQNAKEKPKKRDTAW